MSSIFVCPIYCSTFFHIVSGVYSVRNLLEKSQLKKIIFQSEKNDSQIVFDRSQRFKGSDWEFCMSLRVVNWTCHLGLLENTTACPFKLICRGPYYSIQYVPKC